MMKPDLLDSARQAAAAAGSFACRTVEQGRQRFRLAELRSQADRRLREVGRMIYATHTGNPTPPEDLLAELKAIDELNRRIAELETSHDPGLEKPRAAHSFWNQR